MLVKRCETTGRIVELKNGYRWPTYTYQYVVNIAMIREHLSTLTNPVQPCFSIWCDLSTKASGKFPFMLPKLRSGAFHTG